MRSLYPPWGGINLVCMVPFLSLMSLLSLSSLCVPFFLVPIISQDLPSAILSPPMEPTPTFTFHPIGTVHSPYTATREIPKGLGAEHRAEGTIEILPEYEAGLQDIEGVSDLYVLWVFDRAGALRESWVGGPTAAARPRGG